MDAALAARAEVTLLPVDFAILLPPFINTQVLYNILMNKSNVLTICSIS
nr:MAG TPA: hypothetical protein [Caudoviricetes sp.]